MLLELFTFAGNWRKIVCNCCGAGFVLLTDCRLVKECTQAVWYWSISPKISFFFTGWGGCPVTVTQNHFSDFWRWYHFVGFIGSWPSACTVAVSSWVWRVSTSKLEVIVFCQKPNGLLRRRESWVAKKSLKFIMFKESWVLSPTGL